MYCKICYKQFRAVSASHLLGAHNITSKEYLEKFPGEKIGTYCKEVLGDQWYGIESKRRIKISKNANIDACRLGQRRGLEKRRERGTLKWRLDAPGRKSKKYLGRVPWNKGLTKYTNDTINKMAKNRRKYPEGIDFKLYGWTPERAQEIRKRDYFICKMCQKPRSSIVHHKDGDERHNGDSNLITLCRKCHATVHYSFDPLTGRYTKRSVPLQIIPI